MTNDNNHTLDSHRNLQFVRKTELPVLFRCKYLLKRITALSDSSSV